MSTSTATRTTVRTTRPVCATRPVRTARPAPRPGSVRLTRRGRIVLTLLLLGLVLGAFVIFSGQSVATAELGETVPTRTVVVGEGDTLWEIADRVGGEDEDLREVVHQIEKLNSLSGPVLEVGQEIAVPVGG